MKKTFLILLITASLTLSEEKVITKEKAIDMSLMSKNTRILKFTSDYIIFEPTKKMVNFANGRSKIEFDNSSMKIGRDTYHKCPKDFELRINDHELPHIIYKKESADKSVLYVDIRFKNRVNRNVLFNKIEECISSYNVILNSWK